eukprot:scaffold44460_cov40-Attheya_sp.AAC.2
MPVSTTDSSTLFLEENDVEHHQDTSQDDENSRPEPDQKAFEVIPCRDRGSGMRKKKKGKHRWKNVLKDLAEDHIVNLNHKTKIVPMLLGGKSTAIPLKRSCYLSLKEMEGRFQLGTTTKSIKYRKMPVLTTDSSTLFLEERDVEHHQDTSQDDENSRPEPDQKAFEVIPPCRDHGMRKKKKGKHRFENVLKDLAEDHLVNLNHKNDVDIVVPSVPSKSIEDQKMPVSRTDSSTLFLEEHDVEHHQDTSQDDENRRPEPDQKDFEVIPPCRDHGTRKKKKGKHRFENVLQDLAEDHLVNLNHKNDVDIAVPSVPSKSIEDQKMPVSRTDSSTLFLEEHDVDHHQDTSQDDENSRPEPDQKDFEVIPPCRDHGIRKKKNGKHHWKNKLKNFAEDHIVNLDHKNKNDVDIVVPSVPSQSIKYHKMPVSTTDSSTLFLEEHDVEHHQDASQDDENSRQEPDQKAFEVIPPCRDHGMRKTKNGKHRWKNKLKNFAEDHLVNLNHKNDVNIVAPSVPSKSIKDHKMPVSTAGCSTLFLEEHDVEHHQDASQDDENSRPQPDQKAFEVSPPCKDHGRRKKKKGKHHWKIKLKSFAEDHLVNLNHKNDIDIVVSSVPSVHSEEPEVENAPIAPGCNGFSWNEMTTFFKKVGEDHMNLNHKNNVDIVVPTATVPSDEAKVDKVNSEEELDKATNASEKKHPIAPGCSGLSWKDMPELWEPIKICQSRQDHQPIRTTDSWPSMVDSESGETEVTLATTMKRMENSIAPITQTTSTGTKHQHLWKKMHPKMEKHKTVTVLKKVVEDHVNLNHKNDVDIVVPSVPSAEAEVDKTNSEEELDKATNASEKMHPIAPGCSGLSWKDMPELWEPIKIRQSRQDHPLI